MSQWTHVLGLIRYDYMAQNIWCSDTGGKPYCYNIKEKIKFLKKIYKKDIPEGSEGPIEISVTNSNRGPVVRLTGDLRDFGLSEVEGIISWLNNVQTNLTKINRKTDFYDTLSIRDSIVCVDVEYYKNYKFLMFSENKKSWFNMEVKKEKSKYL
jgi:hypothetical protein